MTTKELLRDDIAQALEHSDRVLYSVELFEPISKIEDGHFASPIDVLNWLATFPFRVVAFVSPETGNCVEIQRADALQGKIIVDGLKINNVPVTPTQLMEELQKTTAEMNEQRAKHMSQIQVFECRCSRCGSRFWSRTDTTTGNCCQSIDAHSVSEFRESSRDERQRNMFKLFDQVLCQMDEEMPTPEEMLNEMIKELQHLPEALKNIPEAAPGVVAAALANASMSLLVTAQLFNISLDTEEYKLMGHYASELARRDRG